MYIHVRLREGLDDDIIAWYEAQGDKSQAVRDAVRQASRPDAVEEVVGMLQGWLPGLVAEAVGKALAAYRLMPTVEAGGDGQEQERERARMLLREGLDRLLDGED